MRKPPPPHKIDMLDIAPVLAGGVRAGESGGAVLPPSFPIGCRPAGETPVSVTPPEPGRESCVVVASPHAGRNYAPELMARAALPLSVLRWSEDAFIDDLYSAAPQFGAALVTAEFPRVFLDVNRAPSDLDPAMFTGAMPAFAGGPSRRAASGLGVVPRIAADGRAIYANRLPFSEAEERISGLYRPYHGALTAQLTTAKALHGAAIVIDAHSMPAKGAGGADIIIGDLHGRSCAPEVSDVVEQIFTRAGFVVTRNAPYAGGHTTERYGRPDSGMHAIQIELNRALYMHERRLEPTPRYLTLKREITNFLNEFVSMDWGSRLTP